MLSDIQCFIYVFYVLILFILGIISEHEIIWYLCLSLIGVCFIICGLFIQGLMIYSLFTCMGIITMFFIGGKHDVAA